MPHSRRLSAVCAAVLMSAVSVSAIITVPPAAANGTAPFIADAANARAANLA
jgi:hypothetical protein